MNEKTQRTKDMLDHGYQRNPQAMLKVDIDPPFVGAEFDQAGCDPSLTKVNDVLYLTFIEGDFIKVAIIDESTMKVTGLFRTIEALNATRPKLVFELSTYPGKPDLPHIAYTNMVTGKAVVYRELYDAQGNVVIAYDEIGDGFDCDVVRIGNQVIDIFVGTDGAIYTRKQGEYAEKFYDDSHIKSASIVGLPDGRFVICCITNDNTVKLLYSQFLKPFEVGEDRIEFDSSKTINILMKSDYFFNESINFPVEVSGVSMTILSFIIDNDLITFNPETLSIVLKELVNVTIGDEINFPLSTQAIKYTNQYVFNDLIQFTLNASAVELY